MRVALKECVWERVGDELVVVFDPREALTLGDPGGQIEALLEELGRLPRTAAELSTALLDRGITLSADEVADGLAGLDSLGLVERAEGRALGDPAETARHFSNLTFFGAFTDLEHDRASYVRRMRDAHALVIGAGGLGSTLVQCLAGLGVGRLTLVDRDDLESRNFARQFLYRHADLGRSKVERAAEWVREYDPSIEVRPVDQWITGPADLEDLTSGVDVIGGGLDGHPDGFLWLNERAVRDGIPLVTAAMRRTDVLYASVHPGHSACLRCDEADRPAEDGDTTASAAHRLSRGMRFTNGLIGPLAALMGSLAAYEMMRYITGLEPPHAAGARIMFDLRTGLSPVREEFTRDPDCPVCKLAGGDA